MRTLMMGMVLLLACGDDDGVEVDAGTDGGSDAGVDAPADVGIPDQGVDAPADVGVDAAGTCTDDELNGTETDVDCGGECPPCDPTEICVVDADCSTGLCEDDSTCASTTDCAALLAIRDATPDGVYLFDPEGDTTDPFEAACDMTTDGGGWTLAMKLTGAASLAFDAVQWTAPDLLNESDVVPNDDAATASDAKYDSFNTVTGSSMRVEWIAGELTDAEFRYDELAGLTLLELFADAERAIVAAEGSGCSAGLLASAPAEAGYDAALMSHGQGQQYYGINGESGDGRVRWGFGSNDEDGAPWGPRMGIGWQTAAMSGGTRWVSQTDCDSASCGCYGTELVVDTVAANLWVR